MNIIIVGGGKTGSYLASLLSGRGDTVRVIESRKTVVQRLEAKLPEGTVVRGMGSSPDVLEAADVLHSDVVIAVTGNDEVNLVVSMLAKMEYGVGRVAIDQADLITRSVEEGLDIEEVYTIMRLGKSGHAIVQGEVRPRSSVVGKAVRDLQLPEDLVLVAVERDGDIVIPNGGTELCAGDRVVAFSDNSGRDFLSHALQ